ncbi:MAG: cupin domain-containing protein [Actinomycetota bacterium]|nr:cupin domain-containing protein [Actinomycetota bacterium]
MPPSPAARLISSTDRPEQALPGSHGWVRVLVDHRAGSRNLLQREFRFGPGRTPELHDDQREEAMYVVEGLGTVDLGGASYELAPGTGVFVPAGASYVLENPGPHDLVLVSVLSPPPCEQPGTTTDQPVAESPTYVVREEDEPALAAGEDRTFKVLVDPGHGCRTMTQFVGFIDRSQAPPHVHAYEEAVFILEGEGVAHVDGRDLPFARGAAIFLPPGVPHHLENTSREVLKLLGVFSPAGSPASRETADSG